MTFGSRPDGPVTHEAPAWESWAEERNMPDTTEIFSQMASRYRSGSVDKPVTYYFSVGAEKWTATLHPDHCDVQQGRQTSKADCVLKCDPKLFSQMVLDGKKPGPFDIARGKIKTNDVGLLKKLPEFFRLGQ